jgi:hypothetical protein
MKNYIFGYGSLIEKASRLRSTPNAKAAIPVVVYGFKRGWFSRTGAPGLSTTFLGCIKEADGGTNGVIYEVSKEDLKLTDSREKGYTRIKINFEDIVFYICNLGVTHHVIKLGTEIISNALDLAKIAATNAQELR